VADRAIFRERAIEAHRRRTERDVLPRLISRRVVVCSWLLLATLVAGALVAWSVRVPSYVAASGVVLGRGEQSRAARGGTAAVLFLPPDQAPKVRVGRPVRAQIGSLQTYVQGAIATVEPGLIGPDAARNRYRPRGGSDLITAPSTAATVRFPRTLPAAAYAGSGMTARVETGSERLLALFPGIGKLV
jgi:hypothetical protein